MVVSHQQLHVQPAMHARVAALGLDVICHQQFVNGGGASTKKEEVLELPRDW